MILKFISSYQGDSDYGIPGTVSGLRLTYRYLTPEPLREMYGSRYEPTLPENTLRTSPCTEPLTFDMWRAFVEYKAREYEVYLSWLEEFRKNNNLSEEEQPTEAPPPEPIPYQYDYQAGEWKVCSWYTEEARR